MLRDRSSLNSSKLSSESWKVLQQLLLVHCLVRFVCFSCFTTSGVFCRTAISSFPEPKRASGDVNNRPRLGVKAPAPALAPLPQPSQYVPEDGILEESVEEVSRSAQGPPARQSARNPSRGAALPALPSPPPEAPRQLPQQAPPAYVPVSVEVHFSGRTSMHGIWTSICLPL